MSNHQLLPGRIKLITIFLKVVSRFKSVQILYYFIRRYSQHIKIWEPVNHKNSFFYIICCRIFRRKWNPWNGNTFERRNTRCTVGEIFPQCSFTHTNNHYCSSKFYKKERERDSFWKLFDDWSLPLTLNIETKDKRSICLQTLLLRNQNNGSIGSKWKHFSLPYTFSISFSLSLSL